MWVNNATQPRRWRRTGVRPSLLRPTYSTINRLSGSPRSPRDEPDVETVCVLRVEHGLLHCTLGCALHRAMNSYRRVVKEQQAIVYLCHWGCVPVGSREREGTRKACVYCERMDYCMTLTHLVFLFFRLVPPPLQPYQSLSPCDLHLDLRSLYYCRSCHVGREGSLKSSTVKLGEPVPLVLRACASR
ncbi:hypothetical protein BHM03_00050710 [Ensete ventricosum]|nr:hypothetical protein BHM03_00050710 [Ensete ventricosum]